MDGPRSKVEIFAAIRRDSRTEKLSIHELSRRYGVHRRLVREALTSPWPTPRKSMPPRASVLDPYKHLIDAILRADLDAPRKQRHTAKRVFDRLVDEQGMDGRLLRPGPRLHQAPQARDLGRGGPRTTQRVHPADPPAR